MGSRKKHRTHVAKRNNIRRKNAGEQKGSNDLLLPIVLIIAVLPFVIYFKEYYSGLARFDWYGIDDTVTDFYSFYKSRFLVCIAAVCVIILLFRLPLYPEKRKSLKPFLPLLGYAGLVVLSTFFSIDSEMSLTGAPYLYENVFVLLSYAVICFYTYQILEGEKDYLTLHGAMLVMMGLMLVFGLMQIAGKDPVNMTWFQKLVMSKADEAVYLGSFEDVFTRSYVYLTTMNPNYAGHFLAMALTYVFAFLRTETQKKKRLFYGVLGIALFILLWFTYSRGALVAMLAGIAVIAVCTGTFRDRKAVLMGVGIAAAAFVFAVLIDAAGGFHFFGRMFDKREEIRLEQITTGEKVTIVYNGQTQVLDDLEEGEVRTVSLDGRDWNFTRKNNTYYYINEFGKYDQIPPVSSVRFGGYEYLGSGRLYIWSRVVPLLGKYFFLGSGPDTFIEAFPQDDYVGKANYSHSVTMYIEKAHNGYLMSFVQTGFPALCCLLVFAVSACLKMRRRLREMFLESNRLQRTMSSGEGSAACADRGGLVTGYCSRMQLASYGVICAYAAGLLWNDSTLFTTPPACVCMGILAVGAFEKSVLS